MLYPSIDELSQGKYNRYVLCIATAKCARAFTEKQNLSKDAAAYTSKDDRYSAKKPASTDKAVKTAINLIYNNKYSILRSGEKTDNNQS